MGLVTTAKTAMGGSLRAHETHMRLTRLRHGCGSDDHKVSVLPGKLADRVDEHKGGGQKAIVALDSHLHATGQHASKNQYLSLTA
eukprot:scaffold37158_cov52-Prasinocladus_malaysianus.AAC.3